MNGRKVVGQFHEKRGDDHFTVYRTEDSDVLQIVQYDAIRRTYPSVDFFAESVPKLVALISKAAGIPVAVPEYEYAIQTKAFNHLVLIDDDFPFGNKATSQLIYWADKESVESRLDWVRGEFGTKEFWMVKRVKAGEIETV